ncbi:hypothetical protein lerEdw1_008928 [Lerista edwardsae]|nr:hypothetical protein lerEdw1_008928 [Lerista edwardsae]
MDYCLMEDSEHQILTLTKRLIPESVNKDETYGLLHTLLRDIGMWAQCNLQNSVGDLVFSLWWIVDMEGAPGTLYEGEKFQLLFKFSSRYPFDSPQVMFTGENIPVHPHVYSNGHICLSILTEDWSPALSVQSVCLSIISMLSSCKEKRRPPDNSFYVRTCNKNPKKTKWWYHVNIVTEDLLLKSIVTEYINLLVIQ